MNQLTEQQQRALNEALDKQYPKSWKSNRADFKFGFIAGIEYQQGTIQLARSEWKTLADLQPGAIFETEDGIMAVKSEYYYHNSQQPECVLLASGEYAHFPKGEMAKVREIFIEAEIMLALTEMRRVFGDDWRAGLKQWEEATGGCQQEKV